MYDLRMLSLAYVRKKQYLCAMKLLDDYIFDERLRYEGHKLIYMPEGDEPIVLGGILGAAILGVRLLNTDEADKRGILLSEELRYEPFWDQYDREVIADDWGYIEAELEQLDLAYLELFSSEQVLIETICPNKRQLSIAMDVVATYMRRIAIEEYGAHIYERVPWKMPFAQWLFDAARIEPRRQRFLQIDWTDPALVHELACYMEKGEPNEQTFFFEGEVHVLSCIFRVGAPNSKVDNVGAGGFACPIRMDGQLNDKAVNRKAQWVSKNTAGIRFADIKIPEFDKVLESVKKVHSRMAHFKLIGWDMSVDVDGDPVFIEYNTCPGSNQISCGPTFGDLTERVLDEFFNKRTLANAQN